VSAHLSVALDDAAAFAREVTTPAEVLGLRMRALARIAPHLVLPEHRDFLYWVCKMPVEQLSERQAAQVTRLAWRYRSRVPPHLAPKCNPDDPIVRELAAKGKIHA
jgi:hypothetical protein